MKSEYVVLAVVGGPIAVWWLRSLYHAWVGNTAKHAEMFTLPSSAAMREHRDREVRDRAKQR